MFQKLFRIAPLIIVVVTGSLLPSQAQSAFDWRRFNGKSIHVMLSDHPVADGIKTVVAQFEAETGIIVKLDVLPEDPYLNGLDDLLAGKSTPDVYFQPMDDVTYTHWKHGLVKVLTPYLQDPSMTAFNYDFLDYPKGFLTSTAYPPDSPSPQNYGIPVSFETYILFYNKDLVAQYLGGQLPKTMDDLVAAAAQIKIASGGKIFGSVVRGVPVQGIMDTVTGFVIDYWGSAPIKPPYGVWFDADWHKPWLTREAVQRGLTAYVGLMRGGPDTIQTFDWPEATQLFSAGKVAFYVDASLFGPDFEDPAKSKVAGHVGYAPLPPPREGDPSFSGHWSWGLSIPATAAEPGAAWYFIQWMTNIERDPIIGAHHGGAARLSTWFNPLYTAKLNPDYVSTVLAVMQTSRATAVLRENWSDNGSPLIVDALQAMYNGTQPIDALTAAEAKLRDFTR